MELKHLHIHVRDRTASQSFYSEWFGMFVARRGQSLTFMTDGANFDLALMDDASPAPMPAWFHFGFRLDSREAVMSLHERMQLRDVPIVGPLYQDESLVSYRCSDNDGYVIEVYWEADNAPID
jgi:catechol-2,3-dioxygenase